MARQANGTYLQPANTAAVSGQTISSTAFNTLVTDIGTELTNSLDRGGRSAMTAALPMGAQKITGMADPTVSTDGATKNYVDTITAAFFGTGDVKLTWKTSPDTGWLMMNDSTIGNAGSGAATASTACLALYTLFWNNISSPSANAFATVTGGLGASAAADWAGLKSMSLPRTMGRALAIAGAGASLTARTLGQFLGAETASLITANLPPYTPVGSVATTPNAGAASNVVWSSGAGVLVIGAGSQYSVGAIGMTSTFTGSAQGGTSTAFSIMQPSTFMNCMVKL